MWPYEKIKKLVKFFEHALEGKTMISDYHYSFTSMSKLQYITFIDKRVKHIYIYNDSLKIEKDSFLLGKYILHLWVLL